MILQIIIVTILVLEGSTKAFTSCAPDVQSARLYQRVAGRPLYPLYECSGQQVLERYNKTTLQYDIINDGPYHLIGYNDGGIHRCWQQCNTNIHQYCYFTVQVIPEIAEVMTDFPPAVLNNPYTGTCDTAGDPRPIVNAAFSTAQCQHQILTTNVTTYTTQAVLRIPSVTVECRGAIFSCIVCQLGTCREVKTTINIIESNSDTHNRRNDVVNMTSRADSNNKSQSMLSLMVTLTVIGWRVL